MRAMADANAEAAGEASTSMTEEDQQGQDESIHIRVPAEALLSIGVEQQQEHSTETGGSTEDVHFLKLYEALARRNMSLYQFLSANGCAIILPRPKTVEKSKELQSRLSRLRVMEEKREYNNMTKDISPIVGSLYRMDGHGELSVAATMSSVSHLLGLGVHLILLAASMFAIGYVFGQRYIQIGTETGVLHLARGRDGANGHIGGLSLLYDGKNNAGGMLGGVLGFTIAIVVDVVLVAIKAYRIDSIERKRAISTEKSPMSKLKNDDSADSSLRETIETKKTK